MAVLGCVGEALGGLGVYVIRMRGRILSGSPVFGVGGTLGRYSFFLYVTCRGSRCVSRGNRCCCAADM